MQDNFRALLTVPVYYFDDGKLDPQQVRNLKPKERTFKISDGRGLYLEVTPEGAKRWRLAYRFAGKQKRISMGVFPETSLDQARRSTAEAKALLKEGFDPSAVRQAAKANRVEAEENTFAAVASAWVAKNTPSWSASTLKQTQARLQNDVLPYIGRWPMRDLTPPLILQTVQRIIDRGAMETARRVLRIIRQICAYAVITGRLNANPATDLGQAIPSPKVKHMAAITDPAEFGGLLRAIEGYQGEPAVRAALQLAPLFFVRPGELRAAEWAEFDLDGARWEIPAARTKMNEPLIVPLARQAVEILRDLQLLTGTSELVFPSARSMTRPISNNTLNAAMRRMGITKDEMTAHGFRATARTLLEEELGWRYEVIEQQLGHLVRDPNGRAYNRTRHLEERAEMMQAWADYLDQLREVR